MSITDRDPEKMDQDELTQEWHNAYERTEFGPLDDSERDEVWDRRRDLWQEMKSRSDVEPPECPECGGQRWVQAVGDPKHCGNCDLVLGPDHEDLIDQINSAWWAIQGRTEEA